MNLSESARERLAAMMPAGARHLDGRFIEGRGDGLALEVALMANSEYVQSRLMIQRVSLDGDDIVSVELREINRLKTGLFTAAISAAAVAVVVKVFSGKAGGGRYPPLGPGPSEAVIPGYRPPITPVWTRVRR